MKIEMNNLEALEQLNEVQKAQQLEMEPPKMEKAENAEQGAENPPKLERGTKLGGTVIEMQLEMEKLRYEQLKKQAASKGATLGESRDVFNARKAFEASTNSIEAKNRAEDLKEAIEEDARKKEEYREKLYGK